MAAEKIMLSLCCIVLTLLFSGCAGTKTGKTVFDYEKEATIAYSDGKYDIAVKRYEYLVDRVPKDANFWFRLANSYAKNGETDKAISAYRNTLLRDTSFEKAWYNLGVIQMQQALKTFIDMQIAIQINSPVRPLAEEKMNGLFILLGQNPDDASTVEKQ